MILPLAESRSPGTQILPLLENSPKKVLVPRSWISLQSTIVGIKLWPPADAAVRHDWFVAWV